MKKRKFLRLLMFLGLWAGGLYMYAQESSLIRGHVVSVTGEDLPGVNIIIKGTTIGTITDINGSYQLQVDNPSQAVLLFRFVGFTEQEVAVAGQSTINVTLAESSIGLDEVIAIGYGVVKKRDLTGAVSSIKSDEIAKATTSNAMQTMQAKIPGLDIQQKDGQAGSGINLNLRGNRSLTASNNPLILVDGVEYGSTLDINASDIESMEVLKDASSTAIYGSRGANGVIIITTKRGVGKTTVNFSSYLSSNQPTNVPKVMYGSKEVQRLIDKANYQADYKAAVTDMTGAWGDSDLTPEQVLTESLEDFTEIGIYEDGSYTNWADLILQNSMTQNYEVSVSGGSEKTNVSLSIGAMTEEGLMERDKLNRYNGKVSVDHEISDVFKVGTNMAYTYKDQDVRQSSVFTQSLKMTTISHAYTAEGELISNPNPRYAAHCNPLLDEVSGAYQHNIEATRFFGNAYLDISPVKNMTFKTMLALDRSNTRTGIYQDFQSVARFQSPGTGNISSEYKQSTRYTWENTLSYNTNLGGSLHDITGLLGHSMFQKVYEQNKTYGDCGQEHYYESAFYDVTKITQPTIASDYEKSAMLSYFGRVQYKYNEKYLITASVRADGSSTLSKGNKWGYFPSVAAAWRVNEEPFMANMSGWLSNLKLRLSWGKSGNAAIDAYETLSTLSSQIYYYLSGTEIAGNIPSNFGNPDLKWETTTSYNFGLDFGMFNNRVSGSLDYYISNTNDLLYLKSAPASSVFPSIIDNIGETKGSGLEIALNTMIVKSKDFSWDVNWTYSTFKDEVVALADGLKRNIIGREAHLVGEPVKAYYDYENDGCWDVDEFVTYIADWKLRHPDESPGYIASYGTPGSIKVVDANDDGKLDDDDKRVYNQSPNHVFGMNNNFTYKNISFSFLVYARLGGYISYDMNSQLNFESANWGDLDYWTLNNRDADFPSPGLSSANAATHTNYGSSLLYEKANYIKIKDITLSYSLPKTLISKMSIQNVNIYGSLKNYFTFSSIDNYDPERGGSIAFPLAKQLVVGLNVQF